MNRETLNYISRKIRGERSAEQNPHVEHGGEYPERAEHFSHPISARYGESTNTYRAEGVVEGRIEHRPEHSSETHFEKRRSDHSKETECDSLFVSEMEDALVRDITDIVYYSELAMEAEYKGHVDFANGFYEIAKEKLSCAERIKHRLTKCDSHNPDSQQYLEEQLDRAKRLFRRL